MAFYTLDLPTKDYPNYTYTTGLDDREYRFNFRYYKRQTGGNWYLSIYTLSGDPLLLNVKLVPYVDILHSHTREQLPTGELFLAYDQDATLDAVPEITLENLNTDFKLYYYVP